MSLVKTLIEGTILGFNKSGGGAGLFSKLDATADPTVNDDVDLGYVVGSRWVNVTAGREFMCVDNTDGAAIWKETTNLLDKLDATVNPTVSNDGTEGYEVGSRWLNTTAETAFVCLNNSTGVAVWVETTQTGGGGGGDTVPHKNVITVDSGETPVAGRIVANIADAMTYIAASGSRARDNRWLVYVNNPVDVSDWTLLSFTEVYSPKGCICYGRVTVTDIPPFDFTVLGQILEFPVLNNIIIAGRNTTGDSENASPIIQSIPDTSGMHVGDVVTGTNIPASTTVLTVDSGTQITLTNNATATTVGTDIVVASGKLILEDNVTSANIICKDVSVRGTSAGILFNTAGMIYWIGGTILGDAGKDSVRSKFIIQTTPEILWFKFVDLWDSYIEVTASGDMDVEFQQCNLVGLFGSSYFFSNHATALHGFIFSSCKLGNMSWEVSGAGNGGNLPRMSLVDSTTEQITIENNATAVVALKNSFVGQFNDAGGKLELRYNRQVIDEFEQFSAPTVNDDKTNTSNNGHFNEGSLWTDRTTKKSYICVDATSGAAVWKEITNDVPVVDADCSAFNHDNGSSVITLTSAGVKYQYIGSSSNIGGESKNLTLGNDPVRGTFLLIGNSQRTEVQFVNASLISTGEYFDIYSGQDATAYRVWFDKSGSDSPPDLTGKTGIKLNATFGKTSTDLATEFLNIINTTYNTDFSAWATVTNVINVTCLVSGATTPSSDNVADGGFQVIAVTTGDATDCSGRYFFNATVTFRGVATTEYNGGFTVDEAIATESQASIETDAANSKVTMPVIGGITLAQDERIGLGFVTGTGGATMTLEYTTILVQKVKG